MIKKKLAIISSRDESCGNASYSKQLAKTLRAYYATVDIIPLDQLAIHKLGQHGKVMDFVCCEIQKYDVINLQYEGILYGQGYDALRFAERILQAASGKSVLITLHSHQVSSTTRRRIRQQMAKSYLTYFQKKSRKKIKTLKNRMPEVRLAERSAALIDLVKKYRAFGSVNVMVHKPSTATLIKNTHGIEVYHHPLIMPTPDDIKTFNVPDARARILQKYQLPQDKVYIGIFGFHGAYKAFDVVISALSLLPEKYHLIMSCQAHPQASFATHVFAPDAEVAKLNALLLKKNDNDTSLASQQRVHFLNHLNENDFKEMIAGVDIFASVYYDVDQGGSGPLSYAVYLNHSANIIVSTNRAFMEYEKNYYNDCFTKIDQGNFLELSYKIRNIDVSRKHEELTLARTKINHDTMAKLYAKLLGDEI